MRKTKKIISFLLAFTMIFSLCVFDASAYTFDDGILVSGTQEDTIPTLSFELVESDGGNLVFNEDGSLKTISKEDIVKSVQETGIAKNFIVAIKAINFDNFSWNDDGMYIFGAAISYDPDCISWEPSTTRTSTTLLKNRLNAVDSNELWGFNYDTYTIKAYSTKSTESDSEVSDNCLTTLNIELDCQDISYIHVFSNEVYVGFAEFSLTKIPDDYESGKTIMTFSQSPTDLFLQFGSNESQNLTYNNADSQLHEYLKLDEAEVNFFPATYTVTYDNRGTTVDTEKVVENGNAANIPDGTTLTPPEDGKFFNNWFYDASGNNDEANATTKFTTDIPITADTIVYADWVDGHTVTFNSNYPADVTTPTATTKPVTVSPASGTTFATSDEPTVGTGGTEDFIVPTGYSFKEWNTAADGSGTTIVFGDSGTDISNIENVYAIWSQDWKIEFVKVKDSTDTDNVVDTLYMSPEATDKTVAKPANNPTRDGYKFNGWYYDDASGTKTAFVPKGDAGATEITGNTVIYADWIKQVTVRFYDTKDHATTNDGSTGLLASETVDENTLYTKLTKIPSTSDDDTTHKYFKGWTQTDGTTVVDFTDANGKVTEDLVVYQDWGDYYKLEFYKEEADITGGNGVYDTKYVNPNDNNSKLAALPTDPTKEGYGFNEWKVYTSGSVTTTTFNTNTVVSGNMILVADWTEQIKITLYPNDGTGSDGLGTKVEKSILPNASLGSEYTAPTRAHYTLKEWNTKANGEGTAYLAALATQTFSSSTTLYAIWEVDNTVSDEDKVTLTFDSVGGSTVNSITVYKGDKIYAEQMPSDPTKTSQSGNAYTFDGWFEAATLTNTTEITAPITMSADKTAYAHWSYTAEDAITVTFNDNGATTTVSPTSIQIGPGDSIGAAWPTDPEKTDNTFGGWYTDTSDELTKKTSTDTFTQSTTLNAKWIANITVQYDANGGDNAPNSVTKPAGDTYEDPATTPTKAGVGTHSNYTFLGWNTKQNGSGTYVPGTNTSMTYQDVADLYKVDGGAAPTEVTLYAQWGALDSNTSDPDPAQEAVTVTFDGNGTTQNPVTKEANPKNKYPQLGDSIGTNNMPDDPERTHYTFTGWNTKADGSGTAITGTTVFNTDLDGIVAANDGTYTITAYAQWEVSDDYDGEKITLTFNSNPDGKGTDNNPITKTIVKGDALGYDITAPTNGNYEFVGWYTGNNSTGNVVFGTDKFSSTATYDADTTFYAKWVQYLLAVPQTQTAQYTGEVIKPKYDIYTITYPNGLDQAYEKGSAIAEGVDFTETNSPYQVTYTKNNTASDLKDVGTYSINVSLKDDSELKAQGAKIAITSPASFEVTEALLTVKVDPNTQVQKSGDTVPKATIAVEGLKDNDVDENVYSIKYYQWNDADEKDGLIKDSELTLMTTDPTEVGKYVVKVEFTDQNPNYKIDSVVSSVEDKNVLLYGKESTASYPGYPSLYNDAGNLTVVGQNIVYEIQANDPSISSISVKSADTTDEDGNIKDPEVVTNLSLKDSDYTTDKEFDNAEDPETTNYYIRVTDIDADEVRFTVTLTNPDTTNLTATGGTVVENSDGTYTVTAPLTNKGATPNVVTITTTAGDASDAPTITYTFNVQQLVEAKIELNYGNSPYGEIMKDVDITDKDAAKAAFNVNNQFTSLYLPSGCSTAMKYTLFAWGGSTDSTVNMDRNDTAIFIYEKTPFKDPGFTATNSMGETVEVTDITRTISVNRLSARDISEDLTNQTPDTISVSGVVADYTFTEITDSSKGYIRPDVYDMEYTFVDPYTNETVKVIRKVVVLLQRGDTNIDNSVNGTDQTPIVNRVKGVQLYDPTTVPESAANLFVYRTVDTNMDGSINGTDQTTIINRVKGTAITPFYNTLN